MNVFVFILAIAGIGYGGVMLIRFALKKESSQNIFFRLILPILCLAAGILLIIFLRGASRVLIPVLIGIFAWVSSAFIIYDIIAVAKINEKVSPGVITMAVSIASGFVIVIMTGILQYFNGGVIGFFIFLFGLANAIEIPWAAFKLKNK